MDERYEVRYEIPIPSSRGHRNKPTGNFYQNLQEVQSESYVNGSETRQYETLQLTMLDNSGHATEYAQLHPGSQNEDKLNTPSYKGKVSKSMVVAIVLFVIVFGMIITALILLIISQSNFKKVSEKLIKVESDFDDLKSKVTNNTVFQKQLETDVNFLHSQLNSPLNIYQHCNKYTHSHSCVLTHVTNSQWNCDSPHVRVNTSVSQYRN